MRVCYCPLNCLSVSSLAHQSPCPLKLEDVKPPSCRPSQEKGSSENDEEVVDVEKKNGLDDGRAVEVILKSSLKKPDACCERGAEKGRVKWMDFVGKELVDVREFEPLESREPEVRANGNSTCQCVIL